MTATLRMICAKGYRPGLMLGGLITTLGKTAHIKCFAYQADLLNDHLGLVTSLDFA